MWMVSMNNHHSLGFDRGLQNMRDARRSPAVLKTRLASLRSSSLNLPILGFEGDDDKIIYKAWINRVSDQFSYLTFACGGKDQLLKLRAMLLQDKTGLANGVYFFVDRDFDDLRGHPPGVDIFVTERYSVENYLVDPIVVDQILDLEFHCHESLVLRARLLDLFRDCYQQFLFYCREVNRRLFIARCQGIEIKPLPGSISKLAIVKFDSVTEAAETPANLVVYLSKPDETYFEELNEKFSILEPATRYRGKFALLFLKKWLQELCAQSRLPGRGVFSVLQTTSSVRAGEFTLSCFASRSPLPVGFSSFVETIRNWR
jgi:hypothetical protein